MKWRDGAVTEYICKRIKIIYLCIYDIYYTYIFQSVFFFSVFSIIFFSLLERISIVSEKSNIHIYIYVQTQFKSFRIKKKIWLKIPTIQPWMLLDFIGGKMHFSSQNNTCVLGDLCSDTSFFFVIHGHNSTCYFFFVQTLLA